MTRRFSSTVGMVVLVSSVWLLPSLAMAQKTDRAYAKFVINPTGCRETTVVVDVVRTKGVTTVEFQYFVQSTCAHEGDFLFYHAIEGAATIRNSNFRVQGKAKKAVLDTVIPVFDDEGGTNFNMGIQVNWTATGPQVGGTAPAVASITVTTPVFSEFITYSISPSIKASISRTK